MGDMGVTVAAARPGRPTAFPSPALIVYAAIGVAWPRLQGLQAPASSREPPSEQQSTRASARARDQTRTVLRLSLMSSVPPIGFSSFIFHLRPDGPTYSHHTDATLRCARRS